MVAEQASLLGRITSVIMKRHEPAQVGATLFHTPSF